MITSRAARELLGISRFIWDRLKNELRPVRYSNNGKLFYRRSEVDALIERKRVGLSDLGRLMNPEIKTWFKGGAA